MINVFPNENKKKIILQIFIRILLKKFSQIFKCELIFLFYFLGYNIRVTCQFLFNFFRFVWCACVWFRLENDFFVHQTKQSKGEMKKIQNPQKVKKVHFLLTTTNKHLYFHQFSGSSFFGFFNFFSFDFPSKKIDNYQF